LQFISFHVFDFAPGKMICPPELTREIGSGRILFFYNCMPVSLTPCFSGVFVAGLAIQPLQRFTAREKPLKRLVDPDCAEHPAKAGC